MGTEYIKYPRTLHLPWSKGITNDDRVMQSVDCFEKKEVVVTCKLDGENTTLYNGRMHARSLDSRHHASRAWLKKRHAEFQHEIPENFRICGENMYAKHTIHYQALTDYFYVFGIYEDDACLSWGDTVEYCKVLGLKTVPVLWRGIWDEEKVKSLFTGESIFGAEQEGYVVRNVGSFHFDDFQKNVAKMVREGHVQTDQNWMHQAVIPNKLV